MNSQDLNLGRMEKQNFYKILSSENSIDINKTRELRLSDIASIKEHNNSYTELLKLYVENSKRALLEKRIAKIVFFLLNIVIMFLITKSFVVLINTGNINKLETSTIISFTTSFLSVFIILPTIIAKYLFNVNEENNLVSIIKNMQEYDKHIRSLINK